MRLSRSPDEPRRSDLVDFRHLDVHQYKDNPNLVEDGQVRFLIHQRKYRYMGS